MANTVTYNINNSSDATSGSNQQFLDIKTDLSFSTVTIPNREGKRFDNTSDTSFFRKISLTTDISLNYLDPSWNFHIALDTSRNKFQGTVVETGGLVPYLRNANVFIYDISYNGRTDTNPDGTPFVPKFYDPSGGSSGNFQGVSFTYAFLGDISNVAQGGATFQGFTYSPMVGDTTEVLPNQEEVVKILLVIPEAVEVVVVVVVVVALLTLLEEQILQAIIQQIIVKIFLQLIHH